MIGGLIELGRELAWYVRVRRVKTMIDVVSLDGTIMGAANGREWEIVMPRWFQARRWVDWLRCGGHVNLTLARADGATFFLRFRTRPAKARPPVGVTLEGGKTIVPRPVPREELAARAADPGLRNVPDEVLERHGVIVRDDS